MRVCVYMLDLSPALTASAHKRLIRVAVDVIDSNFFSLDQSDIVVVGRDLRSFVTKRSESPSTHKNEAVC